MARANTELSQEQKLALLLEMIRPKLDEIGFDFQEVDGQVMFPEVIDNSPCFQIFLKKVR